ncbi:hypothetical protein V6N12_015479 [Hibiscus sabdariffa]|uniref:Uncharacterized protein n=1 Tax=Hibiscus sabdariffa TaxID=183260 RepID=A0ABR2DP69_9ROSI
MQRHRWSSLSWSDGHPWLDPSGILIVSSKHIIHHNGLLFAKIIAVSALQLKTCGEVISELKAAGASWIQLDAPTLVLDLDLHKLQAFTWQAPKMSAIMNKIGETLHMGDDDKKEQKQKREGYFDVGVGQGQAYADGSTENKEEGYYDDGADQGQTYTDGNAKNKGEGYYDGGAGQGQDQTYADGSVENKGEEYYDTGAGQDQAYADGNVENKGEGYYDAGAGQGQAYADGNAENKGKGYDDAGTDQGEAYGYDSVEPKEKGYDDDGAGQGQDYAYGSAENKGKGYYDAVFLTLYSIGVHEINVWLVEIFVFLYACTL